MFQTKGYVWHMHDASDYALFISLFIFTLVEKKKSVEK